MYDKILKIALQLRELVDKEAKKEKDYLEGQPQIFTEFSKDLQFYIDELS